MPEVIGHRLSCQYMPLGQRPELIEPYREVVIVVAVADVGLVVAIDDAKQAGENGVMSAQQLGLVRFLE